ncbi:uncharacterized protein EKO05_0001367 [Ascochyta rabiei]|uniref:Uncharacterized protein n=1 Tax=Didymella rabiei TaxID=5454 RepID=A0A163LGQ6_DIDRA|nr:uncharacterized protein EKO05_0001367 [Ascochyta rabiei]KZM27789.1 hypothetical protein ST47_g1048 [Ascochyta rabiei]UPX10725.1 hypothetical protein EKO05_0001367 [Ascochyta rabiei]
MSSGFVSGGTADNPIERDDEWKQAQREIEEKRREKEELGKQNEGKSLYEVLQANKDAKQEAFEQAARYKLHVTLDDDEADYLDSILETKRKEEEKLKKETREQLDLFRQQQEEAERKALEDDNIEVPKEDQVQWVAPGRKRKKGAEASLWKGIKLRKSSSAAEESKSVHAVPEREKTASDAPEAATATPTATISTASAASPPTKAPNTLSLGLGYVSSDEEE